MDVRYIEPGTETLADRLNAVRALALSAMAADMEIEALGAARLGDKGDSWTIEIDEATDRGIAALDALMKEVEALERDGNLRDLVDLAGLQAAATP